MRRCIFEKETLLDEVDAGADRLGLPEIGAKLEAVRSKLVSTLTEDQKVLFRQFDDLSIEEGTTRVNGALVVACGCAQCAGDKHAEASVPRRARAAVKPAQLKQAAGLRRA